MVRLQACRHSAFVMWVAFSQKPMHASRVLPPPPGALVACSLGLPGELPGDSARLPPGAPLPVLNCVCCWGDNGAIAGACGAGDRNCDWGAGALGVTGLGGGAVEGRTVVGRTAADDPAPERPSCAIAGPWKVSRSPLVPSTPAAWTSAIAATVMKDSSEMATPEASEQMQRDRAMLYPAM